MWRLESRHARGETESLDAVLRRITTEDRIQRVEHILREAGAKEPLLRDMLNTPQTPPHHAEGPMVSDHLTAALTGLYALIEGDLHLIDIEEFRRLNGYEGEIDELEEMIKEYAAFFEVFLLCHDAPKWVAVSFEQEGESFSVRGAHWKDEGASLRAKERAEYVKALTLFIQTHPSLSREELGAQFFAMRRMRAHYAGHATLVHAPVYKDLLTRVANSRRLTDHDRELLCDIIAHHMDPIGDFYEKADPDSIPKYVRFAQTHGYDPDDYIDLLQAAVLLDAVFGSRELKRGSAVASPEVLVNFLRAEHAHAPHRRTEKERARVEAYEKKQQKRFREVGLDGVSLLGLFQMEPGPAFGEVLREIQSAVLEKRALPNVRGTHAELTRRAKKFYEHPL